MGDLIQGKASWAELSGRYLNEMHATRVFRNGNSQAVRIPTELAYERTDLVMQIERIGDEIRIRLVRRSLAEVMKRFAKFSRDFMAGGRGSQRKDMDWSRLPRSA